MAEPSTLPLTNRTRIVLGIARGIAAHLGSDDLSPAHVALGLLREGENPAVALLWRAGVALQVVRAEIERPLQQEAERPGRRPSQSDEVLLPPTPGERRILDTASAEAQVLNAPCLGPEHLLLALLRDSDTPTADVLARHGVRYESAFNQMPEVFSPDPGPPNPSAALAEIRGYVDQHP